MKLIASKLRAMRAFTPRAFTSGIHWKLTLSLQTWKVVTKKS